VQPGWADQREIGRHDTVFSSNASSKTKFTERLGIIPAMLFLSAVRLALYLTLLISCQARFCQIEVALDMPQRIVVDHTLVP
jgi:hypothetical protein